MSKITKEVGLAIVRLSLAQDVSDPSICARFKISISELRQFRGMRTYSWMCREEMGRRFESGEYKKTSKLLDEARSRLSESREELKAAEKRLEIERRSNVRLYNEAQRVKHTELEYSALLSECWKLMDMIAWQKKEIEFLTSSLDKLQDNI